jgi:hypothetical protein
MTRDRISDVVDFRRGTQSNKHRSQDEVETEYIMESDDLQTRAKHAPAQCGEGKACKATA